SSWFSWWVTLDSDLRPTASPISRMLGGYPWRAIDRWITSRIAICFSLRLLRRRVCGFSRRPDEVLGSLICSAPVCGTLRMSEVGGGVFSSNPDPRPRTSEGDAPDFFGEAVSGPAALDTIP